MTDILYKIDIQLISFHFIVFWVDTFVFKPCVKVKKNNVHLPEKS